MDSKPLQDDRVRYLLDDVVISSLQTGCLKTYNGFCNVLEESENSRANKLAEDLTFNP